MLCESSPYGSTHFGRRQCRSWGEEVYSRYQEHGRRESLLVCSRLHEIEYSVTCALSIGVELLSESSRIGRKLFMCQSDLILHTCVILFVLLIVFPLRVVYVLLIFERSMFFRFCHFPLVTQNLFYLLRFQSFILHHFSSSPLLSLSLLPLPFWYLYFPVIKIIGFNRLSISLGTGKGILLRELRWTRQRLVESPKYKVEGLGFYDKWHRWSKGPKSRTSCCSWSTWMSNVTKQNLNLQKDNVLCVLQNLSVLGSSLNPHSSRTKVSY